MTSRETHLNVSKTIERLSAHLDLLAGQVFEVEESLGVVLSEKGNAGSITITKFQALDFTRQSLEDCALLLQLIANGRGPQNVQVLDVEKLSKKLKLDATKALLTSRPEREQSAGAGDLDLF